MRDVTHAFVPDRPLGRTGFVATRLGIGDLADRRLPADTLVATLRRAMDAGLNVIDTAPGYEDGYSEEVVGRALAGRRAGIFVIDKIDALDDPVAPQVEASLGRLGLPSVDLFVFHNVSDLATWARLAAPDGGLDQLQHAVRVGAARFAGLSSHHPDVLLAALDDGRADVLMFPVGPYVDRRYEEEVLLRARARGVGTVCFKTFGAGKLLGDTLGYNQPLAERPRGKLGSGGADRAAEPFLPHLTVAECVRYTLTVGPDVALLGLSYPNEQDAAFAAAREFVPLTTEELAAIRARAARAIAGKGECWWNP